MTKKTVQDPDQGGIPFMNIRLTRPIVFLDIESTGLNIGSDRIVELALLRVNEIGEKQTKTYRVNPGIPIPPEVTRIHGISDSDVADCPKFEHIAGEVADLIRDCDLGGYNSDRFDIPMLAEELARAGNDIDLKENRLVDVQAIYFLKEPRTLAAAYKYYCNSELINAHSALADVEATWEVLQAQLQRYSDLVPTVEALSSLGNGAKYADFAGRVGYDQNGREIFLFGKHKDKRVADVFRSESSYYSWMMNGDFPAYTKKVITRIYEKLNPPRS